MKRLLLLCVIIGVVISAFAVPASAAVYTETFSYDFIDDYVHTMYPDSNGVVKFGFIPAFMGNPSAYTLMAMPSGGIGRVLAFIGCNGYEALTTSSKDVVDGQVMTEVQFNWSMYATKTNHVAIRSANNVTNSWDYTYISPNHDSTIVASTEVIVSGS